MLLESSRRNGIRKEGGKIEGAKYAASPLVSALLQLLRRNPANVKDVLSATVQTTDLRLHLSLSRNAPLRRKVLERERTVLLGTIVVYAISPCLKEMHQAMMNMKKTPQNTGNEENIPPVPEICCESKCKIDGCKNRTLVRQNTGIVYG